MDTYNGWSNWSTWNVALWLDNDESYYRATRNMNAPLLKAFVTEQFLNNNAFGDIDTRSELDDVDWYEIEASREE